MCVCYSSSTAENTGKVRKSLENGGQCEGLPGRTYTTQGSRIKDNSVGSHGLLEKPWRVENSEPRYTVRLKANTSVESNRRADGTPPSPIKGDVIPGVLNLQVSQGNVS